MNLARNIVSAATAPARVGLAAADASLTVASTAVGVAKRALGDDGTGTSAMTSMLGIDARRITDDIKGLKNFLFHRHGVYVSRVTEAGVDSIVHTTAQPRLTARDGMVYWSTTEGVRSAPHRP